MARQMDLLLLQLLLLLLQLLLLLLLFLRLPPGCFLAGQVL
jgi:hypothetical protein